jgi:hypothetical protein
MFCQTKGCTVIEQQANVTDLLLTARSGAYLRHKSTRKPVQKIKIRLMQVKPYLSV